MASKKNSIINGIKIFLSVIFILSILNYGLTSYYNRQIIDKENKIILTDKILNILSRINDEINNKIFSSEKNISQLNIVKTYVSLLTEGGKAEELLLNNKITPVNKDYLQSFSEIEKKLKKIFDILKKESNFEYSYIEKKRSILNSNLTFIIQKFKITKKLFQESASSYIFKKNFTDIFTLLLIIFTALFIYVRIKNKLTDDINGLNLQVQNLIKTEDFVNFESSDEFEPISSGINFINLKFAEISDFINNLLSDNYDVDFSVSEKINPVQESLIKLRDKLKRNIELNNKRLAEEQRRQWFSEGKAKFNDILREANFEIKNLAETSLINMVKFLNAAQGGFFILNENETKPFLELISAFAYDRIKLLTKRIELGDGLVGMCAVEKNTIVVTDVPEDYMQIESGLGEAAPTNILIIPLKTEDNILGVIEIASFYEFKKNEIDFIENIAEDIATTLETTKISAQTSELLQETQKKSEELALRDTEMSEKISELRDAQKETKRSVSEMNALTTVINKVLFKVELTTAGKISSVNNLFLSRLGYRQTELRSKGFNEFIKNNGKKILEDVYSEVSKNNFTQKEIIFITKENFELKTSSFFSAVKNEKGEIIRILMLADNSTYREELQHKNEMLKEELKTKIHIISEKEKEISSIFSKVKKIGNISDGEIVKLKQREENIKKKYETSSDKKYAEWLKDVISEKWAIE